MKRLDVTVVVPTRNESHNIAAFLASLPDGVPLVVVDDSEDDTRERILALRPASTTVVHRHGTVTEARQWGAEAAYSEWLLFTDADIVFPPGYFDALQAAPGLDVVYGPKLSQGGFRRYYHWFGRGQQLSDALGIPAATGSNLLVRRRALFAAGGFDLRLNCNEDSELIWRIKRTGYRVRFRWEQAVYAIDHRRLQRGWVGKTAHTLARCVLLYTGLMPRRWRSHDWGYWSRARGSGEVGNDP